MKYEIANRRLGLVHKLTIPNNLDHLSSTVSSTNSFIPPALTETSSGPACALALPALAVAPLESDEEVGPT
jgi:hypothetical protein